MRKVILFLFLFIVGCESAGETLDKNKIYFFYSNGCPHCHDAMEYIDKKYAQVPMAMVNVGTPNGYDLLRKTARNYKISGGIGTPFITFGDNYILGWGNDSPRQFDKYVVPYLAQYGGR